MINQAKPNTLSGLFGTMGSGSVGGMHGVGSVGFRGLNSGGITPGVIKKTKLSWRSVQ